MFEEFNICPYPGLRSFTEEESLYFKGREGQVIEIIELLSQNQFLMITGASGDGKSSLVYAGLIPNARAGFFKSRFNNWVVADFRPERSPLTNLAKSLSNNLGVANTSTVETELSRGYSSLVDLYINSNYYEEDESRTGNEANLLILVDQFEELFTNPENYTEGVPSTDAQTTVNLLLETARLAKEKGIPIYIVCTMRSDYIGQCTAFRGLPEFIGFSQFFVPRLKRNEIQQIIEEPAELSGNQISRRLVERLIYDLTEGIDQLPILQHALSQIWIAADDGKEEMDLLHYAMVGGMAVEELPDEDQEKYTRWFKSIPETQQKSYDYSSLENVLDIHANKLYESAAEVYNSDFKDSISVQDAKNILAITFACLTKIDQSRAVRNRMTLGEITNIINKPEFDYKKVGRIINIFRKEGNTFIRPFIMEGDPVDIDSDTVLDITHESLIRNWKRLLKWVNTEFSFYEDFVDFRKQLDRWVDSGKSRNFLLPLGPLTYFENWYNECNPNEYWIARYSDEENAADSSINTLKNSIEFLRNSGRKHIVTRTFMKYGAQRIGVVFAVILSLFLSSFYYNDALNKQNDRVVESTLDKGERFLNNTESIIIEAKVEYMLSVFRLDPEVALEMLERIEDPKLKLEFSTTIYEKIILYNKNFVGADKDQLLNIILKSYTNNINQTSLDKVFILRNINRFLAALNYDQYYNQSKRLQEISKRAHELLLMVTENLLQGSPRSDFNLDLEFAKAIRHLINNGEIDQVKVIETLVSPFTDGNQNFKFYYPANSSKPNGLSSLTHNCGYQLVAEMYARLDAPDLVLQSMDSVFAYNSNGSYFSFHSFNNHSTILSYFVRNGNLDGFKTVTATLFTKGLDPIVFYKDFFDRVGYLKLFYANNFDWSFNSHKGVINPIPYYINPTSLSAVEKLYFDELEKSDDLNFINYSKALYTKNKSLITYKHFVDRGYQTNEQFFYELFDKSFEYYDQVEADFTSKEIKSVHRYYTDGVREPMTKRDVLMLYPDLWAGFHSSRYTSSIMGRYLLDKGIEQVYTDASKLDLLSDWVSIQAEKALLPEADIIPFFEEFNLDFKTLTKLEAILSQSIYSLDLNYIRLLLANNAFDQGDSDLAKGYVSDLDIDEFKTSASRLEYLNINEFQNSVYQLSFHTAIYDPQLTKRLVNTLGAPQYKTLAYLGIVNEVYGSQKPEEAFKYLDSALALYETFNPRGVLQGFTVYREFLKVSDLIGGDQFEDFSKRFLEQVYPFGYFEKVIGSIEAGDYYQAVSIIPNSFTQSEELFLFAALLHFEGLRTNSDERWKFLDKVREETRFSTRLQYFDI